MGHRETLEPVYISDTPPLAPLLISSLKSCAVMSVFNANCPSMHFLKPTVDLIGFQEIVG